MNQVLIFVLLSSLTLSAWAQTSMQEADGQNKLTVFGRDVRFNFFNLASTETDKMNDEGGRLSMYGYLTAATYVAADYRLALRLPYHYASDGTDRFNGSNVSEDQLQLGDIILGVQNYNLVYLPNDFEVYWEGRMYLPTGKQSDQTGMITRLRNEFILSRHLGRWFETELGNKISYFVQSRTTYPNTRTDQDGYESTSASLTKRMEVETKLRLWGRVDDNLALGGAVGAEEEYWNKSEEADRSRPGKRVYTLGPAAAFPITKRARFIFTYEDVVDRDKNKEEFGKFLAKNTRFALFSWISF